MAAKKKAAKRAKLAWWWTEVKAAGACKRELDNLRPLARRRSVVNAETIGELTIAQFDWLLGFCGAWVWLPFNYPVRHAVRTQWGLPGGHLALVRDVPAVWDYAREIAFNIGEFFYEARQKRLKRR